MKTTLFNINVTENSLSQRNDILSDQKDTIMSYCLHHTHLIDCYKLYLTFV